MNKQQEKQLRVFGFGLPLFCLFFAWRQYVKHGGNGWAIGFLLAAVVVLGMALFARPWLEILFKYWMKGAHVIGTVITTGILTVLFFAVFTPMSLVLKIIGKDFLRRQGKGKIDSYWIKREVRLKNYTQQF